jgi:hypothetical protein
MSRGYFVQGYFVRGYFVRGYFVRGYFVQVPQDTNIDTKTDGRTDCKIQSDGKIDIQSERHY